MWWLWWLLWWVVVEMVVTVPTCSSGMSLLKSAMMVSSFSLTTGLILVQGNTVLPVLATNTRYSSSPLVSSSSGARSSEFSSSRICSGFSMAGATELLRGLGASSLSRPRF